jgi:ankyrin repeat protein
MLSLAYRFCQNPNHIKKLAQVITNKPVLAVCRQSNSEFIGFSPLHTACLHINVEAVKFLVDPTQAHNNHQTSSSQVSLQGQVTPIEHVVQLPCTGAGAQAGSINTRVSAWDRDLYGRTPMHVLFLKTSKTSIVNQLEICRILMVRVKLFFNLSFLWLSRL